ncbi:MAG: RtcB family protein [Actinobacteria bacterium]|nr:RtcB family protein [Actinomycetota bacterium]
MTPTLSTDKSVLSWASTLEPAAMDQARRTASMPFVVKPLALMPDAHLGKGSTVGSVIATEGAVIPAAVGVDIGCGMAAVETRLTSHDLPDYLARLHDRIRSVVPAGVGRGHEQRDVDVMQVVTRAPSTELSDGQLRTARTQYGSLGSGNHFVEVCLDERDRVWIVLHSGSRGIGNQLAAHHIAVAQGLMKEWFISLPDPDLAYLVAGTPQFEAYVADLLWAQAYAAANREEMLRLVVAEAEAELGAEGIETSRVNCHHNFTQQERHRGRTLWITRKGAIQADAGRLGIIPGSMGTRSYIVEGLGSAASYESCSHGAGRRLSRSAARRTLSVASLREAMEGRSWNAAEAERLVDEHPMAYKDIDEVMEDQRDLVRPVRTLSQILNYKGT